MGTTADKLNKLLQTKNQIAEAIQEKGVSVSGPFRYYPEYIRSIPQEVVVVDPTLTSSTRDVVFYDYDGTILHTYSKDEFLALTELPALPTRAGLACQGWNYSYENAIEYVTKYGKLGIGATYITDDGKTRLYIKIAEKGRMTVPLYFNQSVAKGVTIDWGDGSDVQTLIGTGNVNTSHTYTDIGEYVISLEVAEGCTLIFGHRSSSYCVIGASEAYGGVYRHMLQKVEIGSGVTSIGEYAFFRCRSLASVVIPEGVTSISERAFNNCYPLASVVIPEGVTSIGERAFQGCYSLASVVIPEGVTSIGEYAFSSSYPLASVVIPEGVTSIGEYAFRNCYSLASVVIPEGVTSIGKGTFYDCYSLTSVVISKDVPSIGESMFYDCYRLTSVVISEGVTSIGLYAFYNCYSLASVVIPEGVTSIGNGTFNNCYSLASVVIPEGVTSIGNVTFWGNESLISLILPSSVTSIGDSTFAGCSGMALYDFRAASAVPTLAGSLSTQSGCKIVVPDALYDEWVAATNWSSYASYIVKASEFTD